MFLVLTKQKSSNISFISTAIASGIRLIHNIKHYTPKSILKIIYDYPSLIKHNSLSNESVKENTLCSGIFIRKDAFKKIDKTRYSLQTNSLGKDKKLVEYDLLFNERYIPKAAGSCFIRNKEIITSAYHIIDATGLSKELFAQHYYAVFGITDTTAETVILPTENLIELAEVTSHHTHENMDFIDFKIKGNIPSFIKIPKQRSCNLRKGMAIYVAGYPMRSSLTISTNSIICEVHEHYIIAHVDVFEYSSGSPVFLVDNNELIGFIKGNNEKDFIPAGFRDYMKTNIIKPSESKGKKIILIN